MAADMMTEMDEKTLLMMAAALCSMVEEMPNVPQQAAIRVVLCAVGLEMAAVAKGAPESPWWDKVARCAEMMRREAYAKAMEDATTIPLASTTTAES